jgi:ribonuclease PH
VWNATPVLDLDYDEDSKAETDGNFVMTGTGGIVEVQATAEGAPYSDAELGALLALARKGTNELFAMQRTAIGG